jgi:cytosine deaminase
LRAPRRLVLRRGAVVAESPRSRARLALPGRPESIDFRLGR